MDSFQIIQPSAFLAPYVKHYWFMRTSSSFQAFKRIIPTGMISLIFHRADRLFSSTTNQLQPRAFLSGQGTSYTDLHFAGAIDMISVEFRPAGAKAFFKVPMIELIGQNVGIDILGDSELVELEKLLSEATNPKACVFHIERFFYKRFCQPDGYNQERIGATLQSIFNGQQNVRLLAQTACLSYKQFKRIFAQYVGANPKDYLRVIRFQNVLHTLQTRPDISLTELAYECGYYDQAHFIKEFKLLSGYTPTKYVAVSTPYSDFFS